MLRINLNWSKPSISYQKCCFFSFCFYLWLHVCLFRFASKLKLASMPLQTNVMRSVWSLELKNNNNDRRLLLKVIIWRLSFESNLLLIVVKSIFIYKLLVWYKGNIIVFLSFRFRYLGYLSLIDNNTQLYTVRQIINYWRLDWISIDRANKIN